MNRRSIAFVLAVLALSCSQSGQDNSGPQPTRDEAREMPAGPVVRATAALATTPAPASGAAQHAESPEEEEAPRAPYGEGARAFAKVKDTLMSNYYADGFSEDDLYRAATMGMLEHIESRMGKWNKLMTPRELAEIKHDLEGEVVGIGVHIKFDSASGYTDVLAAIPGSASERAGLLAGDKIVSVNGKLYRGMSTRDVVADIRGKAGEAVTLSVLRGDKLLPFTVKRERVSFDQPTSTTLLDGVGYVRIPSFNKKTSTGVRDALASLAKTGITSLVVDLRQNPGGSFDDALATAELLLPEGAGIVTLKRKGKAEEKHVAKGKPFFADLPLVVLVDGGTASGAEIVTAALQEGRRARVIGARTVGKGSVQTIDDLANGYAFKYTVSMMKTPAGRSWDGVGIAPDVDVTMDEKVIPRAAAAAPPQRLEMDVQLRTAKALLVPRR